MAASLLRSQPRHPNLLRVCTIWIHKPSNGHWLRQLRPLAMSHLQNYSPFIKIFPRLRCNHNAAPAVLKPRFCIPRKDEYLILVSSVYLVCIRTRVVSLNTFERKKTFFILSKSPHHWFQTRLSKIKVMIVEHNIYFAGNHVAIGTTKSDQSCRYNR